MNPTDTPASEISFDPQLLSLFVRFGIAALLGLLVGLEREWAKGGDKPLFAGIRTFPSIALMGCSAAMLTTHAPWFFSAAFFGFSLLVASEHFLSGAAADRGTTTEITSLLVFMLGGLAFWNHLVLAAAMTVVVTGILSSKESLHRLARTMESQDIYATLKFAVLAIIVLPLLPNTALSVDQFPLLSAIHPRQVWLLVVFVSGVAFVGYVASKFVGPERGIPITGFLGGIVSSTAVTASMAERSKEADQLSPQLALATIMASTVMLPRTILEVAAVAPSLAGKLVVPLLGMSSFGALASLALWVKSTAAPAQQVKLTNPFGLAPAFVFGLLYTVVILVTAFLGEHFHTAGVFAAAAISGLVNPRPVSLSVAALSAQGKLSSRDAVLGVLIAALANTVIKVAIIRGRGTPAFRRLAVPAILTLFGGGLLTMLAVYELAPQLGLDR